MQLVRTRDGDQIADKYFNDYIFRVDAWFDFQLQF